MNGNNISQWNKTQQIQMLEYFNIIHPGVLEKIEAENNNLSARDKIIMVLKEIGKTKDTIIETIGLTEQAYNTTMSRIKTKNAS